jgi:hypothetical protein
LRLLRFPEEIIEPSPVSLDAAHDALDRGFVRDGWLVFTPNEEVWGVPVPLEGRAFRVGRWWDCVPAPNPRTVWLGNPVDPDPDVGIDLDAPTVIAEYDGVARRELIRRELPGAFALYAAVPEGLVIAAPDVDGDRDRDVLSLWPYEGGRSTALAPGWQVIASHGSLLAVAHRNGEMTFVDVATRAQTPITKPLPGAWDQEGSFSPDGAWLAISLAEAHPTRAMVAQGLNEPHWRRLALINTATGEVTMTTDRFDNLASPPVWSHNGAWLIFNAPFDKSLFACDVTRSPPHLIPIVCRRGRPSPLIDVTAIIR